TCGQECVLWDKFSIADERQSAMILSSLKKTAMTPYGISLMPYRRDRNHFSGAIWPVYNTGFAQAAARLGDFETLFTLIAQQVRNAVMNKTFYEVLDAQSGLTWRWPSQTWHAAGFLSMFLYGVFGIRYGAGGLSFSPGVPEKLSDISIYSLRYADAVIDIHTHGWGHIDRITANGHSISSIPITARGKITVDLYLNQGGIVQ
ncbi:MAG: hypothetical protein Q4D04_15010, partial [Clostridia bacterium]|nr:hypothetical protein [Clostridia bacterium]